MMAAVEAHQWADTCYGMLLRVYPEAYRRRFADDMRRTFLSDLARVKARGGVAVLAFWIVTIAQAFWFGSAERRASSAGGPVFEPPGRHKMRLSLVGDVRYALRLLRRSPVFTLTAVVSLALGLAGSTVIFGLADALLFKAGPGIVDADRLVEIGRTTGGEGFDNTSAPVVRYLAAHTTTLERIAGTTFDPTPISLGTADGSERVFGQLVSAGYFEVLGVRPALGRFFHADEDRSADSHPVTVLAHRFWQERFGGDREIIGRTIRLNNTTFDVVGVAQAEFEGSTLVGTDLWVPIAMVGPIRGERGAVLLDSARAVWHTAVGRLKPGVSREVAAAELNAWYCSPRRRSGRSPTPASAHHIVPVGTPSGSRARPEPASGGTSPRGGSAR